MPHVARLRGPRAVPYKRAVSTIQQLLTTTQTAETLGLSVRTLEAYRRSGKGPRYVKFGRRTRYAPEDLAAWVESLKRSSTKEGGPM